MLAVVSKIAANLRRDIYSHAKGVPVCSLSQNTSSRVSTLTSISAISVVLLTGKGKAREDRTCAVLDLIRLTRDIAVSLNHTVV